MQKKQQNQAFCQVEPPCQVEFTTKRSEYREQA